MTIKYECDVCGKQFDTIGEIESCCRDTANNCLMFEVCKECAEKLYKSVKKYHTVINVDIEEEE